ncbi:hypothetical protein V6N13_116839 [Hibiscus sabdariffa]
MEFFESQKVRGQRLKTITCLVRGGVRREKVRRDTWMVTRLRHAIRVTAWGTFHDWNDGGKKCGRLEYGSGPNDYLRQVLIIWVGLRKQAVNNGLIMNSQNNGEQANHRRVKVIQWEKRIAMQAWVFGRVKRLGPHRRRKENLRRKGGSQDRRGEGGTTLGCSRTAGYATKQMIRPRSEVGYCGKDSGIGSKSLRFPACGSQTSRRELIKKATGNMAEGVTHLMENLSFSEEELLEIVDLGQQGIPKKKLGIVYKSPRGVTELEEPGDGSSDDRSIETGKGVNPRDKGKVGGSSGQKTRIVKRTLQGKNEVCNPIAAKRNRTTVSNQGCEEDEISEASSPVKLNTTVEAASQPRREP